MSKTKTIATWAVTILLALAFAAAGTGKLMGNPMMHESFAILGLPGWFGYFIGAAEVAGAIGLLIRPLSSLAAAGLAIIMVGAAYFHLVHQPVETVVPALVLGGLAVLVGVIRKGDSFLANRSVA